MMIMPGNNCKWMVHYWQGLYGGLGHLYSPGAQRGPFPHIPYALDNGAYSLHLAGMTFNPKKWHTLLEWAVKKKSRPLWVLIPDVVADFRATIQSWRAYSHAAKNLLGSDQTLAFAVQDGMEPSDVPSDAQVIFVGGTTEWKWRTMDSWCKNFKRVHVGRVNTTARLMLCHNSGAESCDGTGWFRGGQKTSVAMLDYLKANAKPRTLS
jgi:hypothetical protein